MYSLDDTIAAIATPIGEGGIGIIRLSGPAAVPILRALFVGGAPGQSARVSFQSHRLHYGQIVDPRSGECADEVLVSAMRAPRTYTREDVAEVNCHGGPMAMQRVLGLCLAQGARQARPGEFTMRAFVNGRLDLSQAEAVLSVIQARTEAGLRGSLDQLRGDLSRAVREVRTGLMEALAYCTATIDFTEQEIPPQDIGPVLKEAIDRLQRMLATADRGIIFRHGVRAVIVGRPNVGKSSLLNALLRCSRAIVTPVPGTTRDTLEETLNLRGIPVVLVDTAGLNDGAQDLPERLGVERSRTALSQADLILFVVDGSQPLTEADQAIALSLAGRPVVVVVNKVDLPQALDRDDGLPVVGPRVHLSALGGLGLSELEDQLADTILGGQVIAAEPPLIHEQRHKTALERALAHVEAARQAAGDGLPVDFVTIDLAAACDQLGEITGETVTEDLLGTIFSRFCIGK
jgi:tRNA modification GTPase